MRDIQRQIGVSGTLHEFFDRVRTDPALRAGSPAEIQREFESIHQRILAHLPEQFAIRRRTGWRSGPSLI